MCVCDNVNEKLMYFVVLAGQGAICRTPRIFFPQLKVQYGRGMALLTMALALYHRQLEYFHLSQAVMKRMSRIDSNPRPWVIKHDL